MPTRSISLYNFYITFIVSACRSFSKLQAYSYYSLQASYSSSCNSF
jgi:hypothetical protein